MKLIFLGTAEFAVPSLRACAEHHEILAVVTQPERAGHRGAPAPRPVADAARALGAPLLQPARVRDASTTDELRALGADALVVAAYGQLLPAALLDGPRLGGINVHASLLPRWRGASPVAWAILAGDAETGVSIMQMDAGLDTGPVLLRRAIRIDADATMPSLTGTLADMGAIALVDGLAALTDGDAKPEPQDETAATYARRFTRADASTEWASHTGVEIDRRVRALQPWPGVIAMLGGETVGLLAGGAADPLDRAVPGSVLRMEGESAVVAAREGAYRIDSLRAASGRTMSPAAFLRGRRVSSG